MPKTLDPTKPAVIEGVSWEDYDAINGEETGERYTYDNGRLEIMPPPSIGHGRREAKLGDLTRDYLKFAGVPFEHVGVTTLKKQELLKGTDPDDAFYVGPDAEALPVGIDDLDLTIHPPPSVVIEIDRFSPSLPRRPILAAIGVPEVWRWTMRDDTFAIGRLNDAGDGYDDAPASVVLPDLPTDALAEHVRLGRHLRDDQVAARWQTFLRGM